MRRHTHRRWSATSWAKRLAATAGIALVAACQASSASVSPPGQPAGSLIFSVVGNGPVIDPADYGADYLLPGASVVHDGTVHLFPVAFAQEPGVPPRVLHLASTDAVTWRGDGSASLLSDFAIELDDIGAVPSSAFVTADGTWVMYGGGRLPGGVDPIVWRATAPAADGPWTAHPVPVLEPDPAGWDSAISDHPAVVPTEDGYLMAYGGAGTAAPNRNRIGMARSTDGATWTRVAARLHGADDAHALGPSACGVDARSMFEPYLLEADLGHLLVVGVMLEGERDAMEILAAASPNGSDWTCVPGGHALGSEDFPGAPSLHSFVAVQDGGSTLLLVEVLGDASSTIWLARADS